MKKIVFVFLLCSSIFLLSCSKVEFKYPGKYRLVDIKDTEDLLNFDSFIYCDLSIDKKNNYRLEFLLREEKTPIIEENSYKILNVNEIKFNGILVNGSFNIDDYYLKIDITYNNLKRACSFVLEERFN